jgi:uroporphyrinogen decarboxylase
MQEKAATKPLSRRERFIKALNHQEPDRVPIDLGSVGGGITDVAYSRVKEHLGIEGEEGTTTYTTTLVVSQFDERVLRALDVDIRHLGLRGSKKRPGRVERGDGSWADDWGIVYRKAGYYNQIVGNPLSNATLADLKSYPWPDAGDPSRVEGLAEKAKSLYEKTDYGLSAQSVSGGIFQTCCRLRSMEQFLMDMLLDKPFAKELLARVEEAVLNLTDALLSAIGPYVQMVETQDDLGTQRAPLISPALYREMIQPCHAHLSALIKKKTDGKAKVFLHSDGSIFDVLPQVIEAGIEVLNPLQPHAAKMDPRGLKAAFGKQLAFHGGLDQQKTIPFGTPEEAAGDVRRVITALAPGGGYIFAPCHNLQPDVPPQNIVAIYRAAKEDGVYPIK